MTTSGAERSPPRCGSGIGAYHARKCSGNSIAPVGAHAFETHIKILSSANRIPPSFWKTFRNWN
jgi:hypothetical protein